MPFRKQKASKKFISHVHSTPPIPEEKKLSVEFCKNYLQELGKNYTDEQVVKIREALYQLAELDYLITIAQRAEHKNEPPP